MTYEEREIALAKMREVSNDFYKKAVGIGNHPFIEFTGLLNEYIKACQNAHHEGIDFSECNVHAGQDLPLRDHEVRYLNEKLSCIFTGRSVISEAETLFKVTLPDGYAKVADKMQIGDKYLVPCDDTLVGFRTVNELHMETFGTDPSAYNYPIRKL